MWDLARPLVTLIVAATSLVGACSAAKSDPAWLSPVLAFFAVTLMVVALSDVLSD